MSISYSRQEVIEVLCTLEELVVSLDRIGSAAGGMTKDQFNAATAQFLVEHDVFKKCATARRILAEPFDQQAASDDLDRALKCVQPWKG